MLSDKTPQDGQMLFANTAMFAWKQLEIHQIIDYAYLKKKIRRGFSYFHKLWKSMVWLYFINGMKDFNWI